MDIVLTASLIMVSALLFKEWYYRYYRYRRENSIKPSIHKADDGSILIEWITKDVRFYLSIDKDANESSWGFLSRCGMGDGFNCWGPLPDELRNLIKWDRL